MASREIITEQFDRLGAFFRVPGNRTSAEAGWYAILSDVTDLELKDAVREYMRSDRSFFPKPGQLLTYIEQERQRDYGSRPQRAKDEEFHDAGAPCPVCGAVLQLAADPLAKLSVWDHKKGMMRNRRPDDPPPKMRLAVVHDYAAHAKAGAIIIGQHNGRNPYGEVRGTDRDPDDTDLPDREVARSAAGLEAAGQLVQRGAAEAGGRGMDEGTDREGEEAEPDLPF